MVYATVCTHAFEIRTTRVIATIILPLRLFCDTRPRHTLHACTGASAECKNLVCSSDALCVANSLGQVSCRCNAGYVGDGKTCTDEEKCKNLGCSISAEPECSDQWNSVGSGAATAGPLGPRWVKTRSRTAGSE